jgi:hypothetical protein
MMPVNEQRPEIRNRGRFSSAASEVASPALTSNTLSAGGSSVLGRYPLRIALLTGGGDKPYALGIAAALTSQGIIVDFIGSDDLSVPELLNDPRVAFLNLRENQRPDANPLSKAWRVLKYYVQLISYAATAQPKLFHLLWNNKFELFDRTLLTLYYKMLGKKIVLTVHNVNAGKRDLNDSFLNRLSLTIQYNLCHHIFVHTEGMKSELVTEFRIPKAKVSVIPFGINNTVPKTNLTGGDANARHSRLR